MTTNKLWNNRTLGSLLLTLLLTCSPFFQLSVRAQKSDPETAAGDKADQLGQILKLEKVEIKGGAEIITVFGRLSGLESNENQKWTPLVSVLRDTLGDGLTENDRLRYVWPLTYTRPTFKQRFAAAVPFLYTRVGSKQQASQKPPPPALDIAAPEAEVWDKLFWTALQNILLNPYGMPVKATTNAYRRNANDYRKSHIIRALSVLALYQAVKGESAFSNSEMSEIQARLLLTDKTFGGLVDDSKLEEYYAKQTTATRDARGHNWELLRQRAESESLYFEPLVMPDGSATHAMLWVAKNDLAKRQDEKYSSRFLNVANPWTDKRLRNWNGYVETRYYNSEHQQVDKETPGAEAVELIPLGLYGLDNPKIPMLLVDFRDNYNPKKREMSRRVLNDLTRNVLSVSQFGNLPYFLGRTVVDFVTGRRGIDFNQPSRLATYSQLKLLLALNESLNPELREEVQGRLEKVSLNPFENDLQAEAKLATEQYAALMAFAAKENGLAAKVERDRRAELLPLEHGRNARVFFSVLNVLSFGTYVHREEETVNMEERLDIARRLDYHTKFLNQVARSTAEVDITWNLEDIRRSLQFIAEHGANAGGNTVAAATRIFTRTKDDEIRRACLDSLSRINNPKAKTELMRISQNGALDEKLRVMATEYLRRANERVQPIASSGNGSTHKASQSR
jgi:hypothetical protein